MFNKLIILDLDETLLHGSESGLDRQPELMVATFAIYIRPYAREFIGFCFANFQHVAVWTSASASYAKPVCEYLFAEYFDRLEFVWSSERCVRQFNSERYEWDWVKDLKKVARQGYALEQIIMVDNTPSKLRRQYGNLVCIRDFEGELPDQELKYLMQYLPSLGAVKNVRTVEKRGWRNSVGQRFV